MIHVLCELVRLIDIVTKVDAAPFPKTRDSGPLRSRFLELLRIPSPEPVRAVRTSGRDRKGSESAPDTPVNAPCVNRAE